jgi:hypothetical protein
MAPSVMTERAGLMQKSQASNRTPFVDKAAMRLTFSMGITITRLCEYLVLPL